MSDDEFLVLIASLIISIRGWYRWYTALENFNSLGKKRFGLSLLQFVPWISIISIFIILKTMASYDVRNSGYLWFYMIFGAAWVVMGRGLLFYLFDISWLDDAIERCNLAAVYTIVGGIIGLSAFYAGANIGDGPGWWCVAYAGGLAAIAWYGSLWIIEKACNISEKITVERDLPTGIRTGYYLIASGIICSRGAAGDWTSASRTIVEFFDAWPVLLLMIVAILVQRSSDRKNNLSESYESLSTPHQWGIFYLVFAIIAVLLLPSLPQNPIYELAVNLKKGF